MKLVIVESPGKVKKIQQILGNDYKVEASYGHICDLPVKELGIDIKNNFEPEYVVLTEKAKDIIKHLKDKAKKAEFVYLATDPDREGEAISWHLQNNLGLNKTLKSRITFNEISAKAINKAVSEADYINMNLVDAQQARRVLDRLVGYKVSPVLCKKVRPKLSAGRVQSAALKLICDRENLIKAFVAEEFWTVSTQLTKSKCPPSFRATLATYKEKKLVIPNQTACEKVLAQLDKDNFVVGKVKKSVTYSSPYAPFTTSTLQQDAGNKLKINSKMCMSLAQQLYEGVEVNGEPLPLVTYIRTDSVRVSAEATAQAREFIANKYGAKYIPAKPNFYSSKKSAQDAHEAIRPINLNVTPESIKSSVSRGIYGLYKLIYERFLASCASKAEYDSVAVVVNNGDFGFKASGKTVIFDGYTRIYASDTSDKADEDDNSDGKLPQLNEGDRLNCDKIDHDQRFTKAPSRYTESSFIKLMEENGIGRPSTFSTILQTLYNREYVVREAKNLVPTELGFAVCDYLHKFFPEVVNIEFTADMEGKLDTIEEKGVDWREIVGEFYSPLEEEIKQAQKGDVVVLPDEEVSDVVCEKCGAHMVVKMGRFGKYLACPNYPECKNTKSLKKPAVAVETDVKCEKCGAIMLERESKYGKYLACSNYPTCKNTKSLNDVVAKCPKCGADVVKRVSKKGKVYFTCVNNPKSCDFISWDIPAPIKCKECGGDMVIKDYKNGKKYKCTNKECGHSEDAPSENN